MKKIESTFRTSLKKIAVLIDPDKTRSDAEFSAFIDRLNVLKPAFVFVGGSTVEPTAFHSCMDRLKKSCDFPIVIFPGSQHQVDDRADAILFLSLISGRNPDYLIGHHVEAAPRLKFMDIEVIPTGYLLIDGGKNSSVQYVSQTTPIPRDQVGIAVKTALAGELLGMRAVFLDAGSGAVHPVSDTMISEVKKGIALPLIVGGGLSNIDQVNLAFDSGADIVVIGNKIEEDMDFMLDLIAVEKKYN